MTLSSVNQLIYKMITSLGNLNVYLPYAILIFAICIFGLGVSYIKSSLLISKKIYGAILIVLSLVSGIYLFISTNNVVRTNSYIAQSNVKVGINQEKTTNSKQDVIKALNKNYDNTDLYKYVYIRTKDSANIKYIGKLNNNYYFILNNKLYGTKNATFKMGIHDSQYIVNGYRTANGNSNNYYPVLITNKTVLIPDTQMHQRVDVKKYGNMDIINADTSDVNLHN